MRDLVVAWVIGAIVMGSISWLAQAILNPEYDILVRSVQDVEDAKAMCKTRILVRLKYEPNGDSYKFICDAGEPVEFCNAYECKEIK